MFSRQPNSLPFRGRHSFLHPRREEASRTTQTKRMDDFEVEFDFEDELNADVGQPTEAPQSMPANARKNYRQVRVKQRPINEP